jgi:hypothetical protein
MAKQAHGELCLTFMIIPMPVARIDEDKNGGYSADFQAKKKHQYILYIHNIYEINICLFRDKAVLYFIIV